MKGNYDQDTSCRPPPVFGDKVLEKSLTEKQEKILSEKPEKSLLEKPISNVKRMSADLKATLSTENLTR